MGKLNTPKLRTLTQPGVYGDGGGLYLQVRDAAHRSWIYRYSLAGKARWMGLGAFPDIGLADAREAAAAARRQARQGLDPIDSRKADAKAARAVARTFGEVADAYVTAHEAGWRNPKHRAQWRSTLDTYAAPVLGKLSVAAVDVDAILQVLQPIWNTKTETASRLRGRIEAVLNYAAAQGWRTGENPARWRGHLDNLLAPPRKVARVEHHAALPWREIAAFMAKLATQEGVAALTLRFAILTAARTGEAIGATWAEIDLSGPDSPVWTVPAERMKANRQHRSPLSSAAVGVLREAEKLRTEEAPDAPVFPGAKQGTPLSNMALLMLLRRMGHADLTAHGFRSTFRDWAAENTNHPRELAEAALAHALKDKTEAAYQRGDLLEKRRVLMADWAAFCGLPARRSRRRTKTVNDHAATHRKSV